MWINPLETTLIKRIGIDRGFLVIACVVFTYLFLYTIQGYGLTWDAWEYYMGDKNFNFYGGFNSDYLDYGIDNVAIHNEPWHPDFFEVTAAYGTDIDVFKAPHLIWPFGHTSSSFTKYLFTSWLPVFDAIDAHHCVLILYGIILIISLYYFVKHFAGRTEAVASIIMCFIYPRFWAHLHNNLKDIPIACFFVLIIYLIYIAVEKEKYTFFYAAAACWGVALATKANALFIPLILLPYIIVTLLQRRKNQIPLIPKKAIPALLAFPFIALITMFCAWPFLLTNFPVNIKLYISSLFDRGYGGSATWNREPIINFLATIPLSILFLFLTGLALIIVQSVREKRCKPVYLILLAWFIITLLRVSIPGASDFDGIRHWLEIIPCVAIIAGIAAATLIREVHRKIWKDPPLEKRLTASAIIMILFLGPLLIWNYNEDPNGIAYYNPIVGYLPGAQEKNYPQSTDYWGQSYRQGMDWLLDNAEADSALYVGVAQHIVYYTREIWLRQDIQLRPFVGLSDQEVLQDMSKQKGAIYFMFITRKEWYKSDFLRRVREKLKPVHVIDVDGGAILEIYR
ncbi:glycosyltransferase family 39 protein, partial [bacterium AH-315-E10]|nr:glycosyltransferase family 39 protein [bacterium AH-315-E10]